MAAVPGRFASSMDRHAATHRPPILASLCLLGAVVSLGPARPHPAAELEALIPIPRPPIGPREFSGDPRIVTPIPLPGDWAPDRVMVIRPPAIDPLIFIQLGTVELGLDDMLSGFLRVVAGPPPHEA